MTRIEYDLVREDRKDLWLPQWINLSKPAKELVKEIDREKLIAVRTAKLLGREDPKSGQ